MTSEAKKSNSKVSAAFFADNHKAGERAKLDAYGIFDRFMVWGLPATRECSIVARIENVQVGSSQFTVFSQNKSKTKKLTTMDISSSEQQPSILAGIRAQLNITKSGSCKIGIQHVGAGRQPVYWIPFFVDLQPWAELPTGEKLERVLANPHSIKAMRASINCEKCGKTHSFQLSLTKQTKKERGIKEFPTSGRFKCPDCGKIHHLKDIEGQLRYHLSNQTGGN